MFVLLVRVEVRVRVRGHAANVTGVKRLSGVGSSVFLQINASLELLTAELTLELLLHVDTPPVAAEGPFVRIHLMANLASYRLVVLVVNRPNVDLQVRFSVDPLAADVALNPLDRIDPQMLLNVPIHREFRPKFLATGVADMLRPAVVHVGHVTSQRCRTSQRFVTYRANNLHVRLQMTLQQILFWEAAATFLTFERERSIVVGVHLQIVQIQIIFAIVTLVANIAMKLVRINMRINMLQYLALLIKHPIAALDTRPSIVRLPGMPLQTVKRFETLRTRFAAQLEKLLNLLVLILQLFAFLPLPNLTLLALKWPVILRIRF